MMVKRNDHCIVCQQPSLLLLCPPCKAKAEARKAKAGPPAPTSRLTPTTTTKRAARRGKRGQ